MKTQKGVALTSIIIYVIMMLVVISIISVLTSFFYKNVNDVGKQVNPSQEFTKFNSYFIKDINETGKRIFECDPNGKYIILSDGTQYTFENNSIYRDRVKIGEEINNLKFECPSIGEETDIVYVKYKLIETDDEKQIKFTLE